MEIIFYILATFYSVVGIVTGLISYFAHTLGGKGTKFQSVIESIFEGLIWPLVVVKLIIRMKKW